MNPKIVLIILKKVIKNLIKMMLTEKMVLWLAGRITKMTETEWDDHVFAIVKAGYKGKDKELMKATEELFEALKAKAAKGEEK